MALEWLGPVVSGTAGLINGIFNSGATGRANKRNIQFARESQQEQERFAKEMFNMENAYNDPSAVMDRLGKAGINPNAYWSQSSGTAGLASGDSSVSPVTPNIQPIPSPFQGLVGSTPFQSLAALADLQKTKAEIQKIGGETKQIDALIENTSVQTEIGRLNQENLRIKNEWLPKKEALAVRKATEEITEIVNKANLAASDSNYKEALAILADADYSLKKQQYLFNETQYPQILANLKQQYKVMESEQNRNNAAAYQATQTGNYMGQLKLTEEHNTRIKEVEKYLSDWSYGQGYSQNIISANHRKAINEADLLVKSLDISDVQKKVLLQNVELAKKENNVYYIRFVLDQIKGMAAAGAAVYGAGKFGVPTPVQNPLPYNSAGPWTPLPWQNGPQPFINR